MLGFQPAWLLHARPYRETSALAWLLTLDEGRTDVVVRGVRSQKSRYRALLQPFTPLQVSLRPGQGLRTLVGLESTAAPAWLQGEALVCGWYANELLGRLLPQGAPCQRVFRDYSLLINLLSDAEQREPALRRFELSVLDLLGAAPVWQDQMGLPLSESQAYVWQAERGFCPIVDAGQPNVLLGAALLAMAQDDWRSEATRQTAKRLTRMLLSPLLGERPLHSRQLWASLSQQQERTS